MSIAQSEEKDTLVSLVAFSAAQAYSVNTNNPFDVVLPLFQPIAAALHGKQYFADDLAKELLARYDLKVSEELCQYWATRLLGRRLLVPLTTANEVGAYSWNQGSPVVPDHSFATELTELITRFRKFLGERNDLISANYSDHDIATLLRRGAIGTLFLSYTKRPISSERRSILSILDLHNG